MLDLPGPRDSLLHPGPSALREEEEILRPRPLPAQQGEVGVVQSGGAVSAAAVAESRSGPEGGAVKVLHGGQKALVAANATWRGKRLLR